MRIITPGKASFIKKEIGAVIMLMSLFLMISCGSKVGQKSTGGQWFKGNLHTHSYWSDGDEYPEVIMDWYKSHGYNFIALSDHNILAEGYRWIELPPEDTLHQKTYKSYIEKYGTDWVNSREVDGKIQVKLKTLEEYRGLTEEAGEFLIIQSEEITDRFEDKPLHMNATNIQNRIEPQGGNSVTEVLQNNINEVIKQREETGVPMIPHVNHPNYGFGISLEDMIALTGEHFFEVYNGHPLVHNMGDSMHMSTESMWDHINISYLQQGKPIMYGLATDDSHHYHRKGSLWSNAGRGWIMVLADTLTPSALITSLEEGRFYASTGVTLKSVLYDDIKKKLSVRVKPESGIVYTIAFFGYRRGEEEPELIKSVVGVNASLKLDEDIVFARAKITSSKPHNNPIEDLLFEMAWTQPFIRE